MKRSPSVGQKRPFPGSIDQCDDRSCRSSHGDVCIDTCRGERIRQLATWSIITYLSNKASLAASSDRGRADIGCGAASNVVNARRGVGTPLGVAREMNNDVEDEVADATNHRLDWRHRQSLGRYLGAGVGFFAKVDDFSTFKGATAAIGELDDRVRQTTQFIALDLCVTLQGRQLTTLGFDLGAE